MTFSFFLPVFHIKAKLSAIHEMDPSPEVNFEEAKAQILGDFDELSVCLKQK